MYYSNRALCHTKLGHYDEALEDWLTALVCGTVFSTGLSSLLGRPFLPLGSSHVLVCTTRVTAPSAPATMWSGTSFTSRCLFIYSPVKRSNTRTRTHNRAPRSIPTQNIDPGRTKTYTCLGAAYLRLGRPSEAKEHYQMAQSRLSVCWEGRGGGRFSTNCFCAFFCSRLALALEIRKVKGTSSNRSHPVSARMNAHAFGTATPLSP